MQCERLQFGLMHRFGQLEYDKAQKGKGKGGEVFNGKAAKK